MNVIDSNIPVTQIAKLPLDKIDTIWLMFSENLILRSCDLINIMTKYEISWHQMTCPFITQSCLQHLCFLVSGALTNTSVVYKCIFYTQLTEIVIKMT